MKYGLLVKNTKNNYQIDNTNRSINLIKKQLVNIPNSSAGRVGSVTNFPAKIHNATKLIAADSSEYIRVGGMNRVGSGNANAFIMQPISESVAGTVRVWEFGDSPVNWHQQKMGLVVLDNNGKNVLFNSNWGLLKIVNAILLPTSQGRTYWSYDLPAGKELAFCIGGGNQSRFETGYQGEFWGHYWRRRGNKLEIKFLMDTLYTTASEWFDASLFPITILILDVTGL